MVQPIKIYVGNVPQTARNSELKELFEKFGKVVECDILKEFAFVHMDDTNGAKAAIAGLNDSLWKGSRIRVELSTTKTSKGEPSHRYRNHEDTSIDRLRRRSSDRERDRDRRNYSSFSSSSSRANDTYSYKDERSLPYDRYGPIPHRLAKSDLGPIRESRYGSSSSSRGYLPERGRPYPDAYDRGLDDRSYPPIRSGAPRMYSGNYSSYASGPYRSGSPHDYSRELRDSRGLEYSDPYMRPPPIGHYPPHGSYYRGPPIPPAGSSR
jgi:RNA recognition motif-containing protein